MSEHKAYRGVIKHATIVQNRIFGDLYESPLGFPNGTDVRTSEIVSVDGMIYETRNSRYCVELAETDGICPACKNGYIPEPD